MFSIYDSVSMKNAVDSFKLLSQSFRILSQQGWSQMFKLHMELTLAVLVMVPELAPVKQSCCKSLPSEGRAARNSFASSNVDSFCMNKQSVLMLCNNSRRIQQDCASITSDLDMFCVEMTADNMKAEPVALTAFQNIFCAAKHVCKQSVTFSFSSCRC